MSWDSANSGITYPHGEPYGGGIGTAGLEAEVAQLKAKLSSVGSKIPQVESKRVEVEASSSLPFIEFETPFPAGTTPYVVVQNGYVAGTQYFAYVQSITNLGFSIRFEDVSGTLVTTGEFPVTYIAIEPVS